MKHRVIGLSGLAGSGKDMFYSLLEKQIPNIKRFALADHLKIETAQTIKNLYEIDIFNCSREEKNLVRPFLVAHGKIKRDKSQGKYWTDYLTPFINNWLNENPENVACITDIRYDIFPEDEIYWIKNKMNGALIHISLYENVNGKQIWTEPPNKDEAENDPKLKNRANFKVIWPKLINQNNQNPDWNKLSIYATECIKYLEK